MIRTTSNRRPPARIAIFLGVLIFFLSGPGPVCAETGSSSHQTSGNARKFQIAYYEGGHYSDYTDCMRAIIHGLIHYGWIENTPVPLLEGNVDKPYWQWLSSQAKSSRLSFAMENAFSAGWSEDRRKDTKQTVLNLLNSGKIDLVIAMGTWAGQDLSNLSHHVPTLVTSTSNPIQAGIIQSAQDSGIDHVTARVDSKRYLRQIRMFHRIVGFKNLGVIYEESEDGRLYSAIKELEMVAKERHFNIVRCTFIDSTPDRETSGRECIECMKQVAKTADAFYVTAMLALDEQIDQMADILNKHKIPSFSMVGSKYVKKGILLSISTDEGYRAQGLYDAKKMIDILKGATPRDLNQELPDPLDLVINMDTARAIGFHPPAGILRISKKIYENSPQ